MSEPVPHPVAPTVPTSGAHAVPGPPAADRTTGDDAVDEALRRLDVVEALSLPEQVTVLEAVHGALQDRLADGEG